MAKDGGTAVHITIKVRKQRQVDPGVQLSVFN